NPYKNPNLSLELTITEEEGKWKVKNITKMEDTLALKFSGTYRLA
ncbi:MAG TPA: 3-hydroxyacyl-ACP dehydratase, partial [Flavobacteriaceae bacterium]|nr:3-hydroxyacyl-ACP dehydratase [Flavobacteriaceae bacterium]